MAYQVREAFEAWATTQDVGLPGSFTWIAARKGYLAATASHAAEVEALRADAERYRWLRDKSNNAPDDTPTIYSARIDGRILYGPNLDDAIDDALKGDKP